MLVFFQSTLQDSVAWNESLSLPDAFFQFSAALLFLFCAAAATCAAQSTDSSKTDSAKTDSASRAAATYQRGMWALKKGDLVFRSSGF